MPRKSETSTESAFKNWINPPVVRSIAQEVSRHYSSFDSKSFLKLIPPLDRLELKGRVKLITDQLYTHLPKDYVTSLKIIHKTILSEELAGFSLWPFSEYISQYGLDNFDESLTVMYDMTTKFTAEFCVRPFFNKDPKKVLKLFSKWSKDPNVHIRRWVSEGSRPLLPWGERIEIFKNDPTHTLPLLDKLKYDEEIYVRKSVANHLNDHSKNHPEFVIQTLKKWESDCPKKHTEKINWIKRHALRTLIKKGHPKALQLMGANASAKISLSLTRSSPMSLKVGDTLEFQTKITSASNKKQKLIVDYAIHFIKKNGARAPKVFKLKTFDLLPKTTVQITKRHSLKKVTTRVYNTGKHKLSIQVNGKIFKELEFFLKA